MPKITLTIIIASLSTLCKDNPMLNIQIEKLNKNKPLSENVTFCPQSKALLR